MVYNPLDVNYITCTDAHLTLRQDGNYDLIINYLTEDGRKITVEGIVGNIRPQIELSDGSCSGTISFDVGKNTSRDNNFFTIRTEDK